MKLALLLIPLFVSQAYSFSFCSICEAVVGDLEQTLGSSATIQDLDNEISKLCKKEFSSGWLDTLCDDGLDEVAKLLLGYIQNNVPPAKACADIHLCKGKNQFKSAMEHPKPMNLADSPVCVACKGLVGVLVKELTNPTVEKDIMNELLQVCKMVPSSDQAMCQSVINSYFSDLWNEIIKMLNPDSLCTQINLCKPASAPYKLFQKILASPWGNIECNFCTTLFNFVESNLVDATMQQQLENELKQVCKVIPNMDYQQKCVDMINKYSKELFSALKGILAPAHMCPILHMCSSK